jgi:sodium-coupled neutral amino acid transporter 10
LVVYSELHDPSIKKMNKVIDASVILVFAIYLVSGLFGYIAFYNFHIHGNIITNIPNTFICELMVCGFIICCVFGYPFMVYPCRTSLNTLLFTEVRVKKFKKINKL